MIGGNAMLLLFSRRQWPRAAASPSKFSQQHWTGNAMSLLPRKIFNRKLYGSRNALTLITTCSIGLWQAPTQAQLVLEEVVVTAQKREQSLQDVPLAVSAFSGQTLQQSGIKDVFDLQVNAPGLMVKQNQNATTSSFAVRGIGSGGDNFGIEPSVGLYADGIYRARQNSMISQLVDIESVEILHGPQGTLFGRNTLSGAVHFKTAKPDHEGTAFLEASVGNYGLLNVSGAASVSVIEDVLALRFVGFSSDRDGWIDNLATEETDVIFDRDRFGFRAQALWTPTDEFSIRLLADYGEIDEVCCGAGTITDNLRVDQRFPDGTLGTDSIIEPRGGTFLSEATRFDNAVAYSRNPVSESEDKGASIQADWSRGDYTFTSISGWRKFDSFDEIDADFTDLDALLDSNNAAQESYTQELRVSYVGGKLNYVAGAYYFSQDLDSSSTLTFGADTEAIAAVFARFVPSSVAAVVQFPLGGGLFIPGDFANDSNNQDHESWALFGQFDYELTESLILTAGLRYSDEDKALTAVYTENGVSGGFSLPQFPATQTRDDVHERIADSQVTGTIKLSWFATDDTMVYASYGTGYKAGGTNTDRIDPAFDQTFEAETSESYELGIKAEFPDRAMRLNVSLYYTPVDDFQVATFTGSGFNVANAATAITKGGEIELTWQAAEKTTVTASYAKTIADFDEFERGNCWQITPFRLGVEDPGARFNVGTADNEIIVGSDDPRVAEQGLNPLTPAFCDRSGGRLGTNPEDFVYLGVRHEFRLRESMTGFVLGEYSYYGDMVLDQSNEPFSAQDAYGLANLRAGLYFESVNAELTFWGRNIFNEEYNSTAFPGVLQDGRLNAYSREPRTYGVTIRKDL